MKVIILNLTKKLPSGFYSTKSINFSDDYVDPQIAGNIKLLVKQDKNVMIAYYKLSDGKIHTIYNDGVTNKWTELYSNIV